MVMKDATIFSKCTAFFRIIEKKAVSSSYYSADEFRYLVRPALPAPGRSSGFTYKYFGNISPTCRRFIYRSFPFSCLLHRDYQATTI